MNYFIATVMFIGLLMMVNIDKFKDHPVEPVLRSNTEPAHIKIQEYSQEPQALSEETTHKQSTIEIFKCKNSSGKIVYSESECPSNTIGNAIVIKPNVIDSTELRRQIASNRIQTQLVPTNISESNADLMSPFKKETRIRELNISESDEIASYEKRADARNELSYLKDKNPRDLSYDLEQQRKSLKVDLEDYSSQKRSSALTALANIYTNYR